MSSLTLPLLSDFAVWHLDNARTGEAIGSSFLRTTYSFRETGTDLGFQTNDGPSGIRSPISGLWAALIGVGLLGGCASLAPPPSLASDPNIRRSQAQPLDVGVDPYVAFNRALSHDFASVLSTWKSSGSPKTRSIG